MAMITVTGNLGKKPELRYTSSGIAVAEISIAENRRVKDSNGNWVDGDPIWWRATVWRRTAELAVEQLDKGMKVMVTGELKEQTWEKDNVLHSRLFIEVRDIAKVIYDPTGGSTSSTGNGFNFAQQAKAAMTPQMQAFNQMPQQPGMAAPADPWNTQQPQQPQQGMPDPNNAPF